MDLKLGNLSRKHKKFTTWPKEKKLQAVTQYLALGNMRLVAATTGVDYGILRQWKMQPWWKEYETEIRSTENLALDSDLTKIVNRSLEAVADRLENGEVFYDQKSGELRRKPVVMKDAAKVATDLLTKRELLRGNATARTESTVVPMEDQLKALANEFARMAQGLPAAIDIPLAERVDNLESDYAVHEGWEEGLQEGSETLHESPGCDQEADGAECSPESDGEGGESPQG